LHNGRKQILFCGEIPSGITLDGQHQGWLLWLATTTEAVADTVIREEFHVCNFRKISYKTLHYIRFYLMSVKVLVLRTVGAERNGLYNLNNRFFRNG